MSDFKLELSKREVFDLWMENDHVLVHLNPTLKNVIVPNNLKENGTLTLKLSHLFQGRTESSEEGVSTYLKFSGDYFECILPWESIFAMTNHEGEQKVWPTSILSKLSSIISDVKGAKAKLERPALQPLETKEVASEDSEDISTKRKRPTLQRIK